MSFPQHLNIQSHKINIAARYAETDKGGVVHHSVYPVWFEMGRTELLRANGVAYKDLEAAGVLFVVARLNIKFRRPHNTTSSSFWRQPARRLPPPRSSMSIS